MKAGKALARPSPLCDRKLTVDRHRLLAIFDFSVPIISLIGARLGFPRFPTTKIQELLWHAVDAR